MSEGRKKKYYATCSVVGCNNAYGRDIENLKMYCFPNRNKEQRELWIKAIKRVNEDGTPWKPQAWSRICSKHFITGKYSPTRCHPDYFPTLLPTSDVNLSTLQDKIRRHNRFMKKREVRRSLEVRKTKVAPKNNSKSTQTDTEFQSLSRFPIFVSNSDGKNLSTQFNAPAQTFDSGTTMVKPRNLEKGTSTDNKSDEFVNRFSIRNVLTNEDFKVCCGIEKMLFDMLLSQLKPKFKKQQGLPLADRLLLFLVKLKQNLSFNFLSTMFNIHRATASVIFSTMLDEVFSIGEKWIYWLSKEKSWVAMPQQFKENYPNTTVIINSSEIKIESPKDGKGANTLKFLIGIAPNEFIMFLSKCYDGKITNSLLTTDSGFYNFLAAGDEIMADKNFSPIINDLNKKGAVLTTPTFKSGSQENVRFHVDRVLARMKIFKVLNFADHSLVPKMDKIIVCIGYFCNHLNELRNKTDQ